MADKTKTTTTTSAANQLANAALGQTAHTATTAKLTGVFKYKLTFSDIKAFELSSEDFSGKNEPYLRFKLDEEHIQETDVAKDLKKPEWANSIVIETSLQQQLEISVIDSDSKVKNILSDDVVGSNVFTFKDIATGTQAKKFLLTKQGKAAGYITANLTCEVNKDYEKQAGYKGIILISEIKGKITRDTQTFGDMDPLCVFKFDGETKSTFRAVDGDSEPVWAETIILGLKGTASTFEVKVNNVDSKGTSELGVATVDVKDLIAKNGVFLLEEVPLLFNGKASGSLTLNLEYRPFEFGESAKVYESRRNQGKVNLTGMNAKLTRDTEAIGKMDPYLQLKFNDIVLKTAVLDGGGKEPNWKEAFSLDVFTYQKTKKVVVTVMEADANADDLVGEGELDLAKYFAADKVDKPAVEEKVEIFFEKKSAGVVFFKIASESNKQLIQLLAEEEAKKKKEEEERLRKEKEAEEANLAEQKKKQAEKDAADAKAKADIDAKAKEGTDAKAKVDADAKKKLQEQDELKKKKDLEEQKKKQSEQQEEEDREMAQMKAEQQRLQQTQLQNDSKLNRSKNSSGSRSLKKLDDYKTGMRNLKNGFGMSEFQSANTLQNSVVSSSFTKERRFQASIENQQGPSFIVLPSIFSNSKKGAGFGSGTRGALTLSQNPGPGQYEISSKLFQRNASTFGESRSRCKNSIAVPKMEVESNSPSLAQRYEQSLVNSRSEVKLPQIKSRAQVGGGNDPRLQMYPSHPSEKNFHYVRSHGSLN